ncbi:hypothetical protein ACAG96_07510 [Candidatus Izemoplasma sp. B36]|uniref:hypothetical protein n=1 Tax=Candidatus Izemoplasma sp. B36 TaxID=3242468 RepID=UPI003557F22A
MSIFSKLKERAQNRKKSINPEDLNEVSVVSMEAKYEADDLVGASKDLKRLLEYYGQRKKSNHRYKGRNFIHFILSNKHKNLKNTGYEHWQNINQIISLNHKKVYPYHKENLRKAMDFFEKEVKTINSTVLK